MLKCARECSDERWKRSREVPMNAWESRTLPRALYTRPKIAFNGFHAHQFKPDYPKINPKPQIPNFEMASEATPRINARYLEQFSQQTVRIVGKVVSLRGEVASLEAEGNIVIHLNMVGEIHSKRHMPF